LDMPSEATINQRAFEIELYKCLPVPLETVSFDDMLEFKETYDDELMALRTYFDELYLSVIGSGDFPRAKNHAIDRLEESLGNVIKALDGRGIKYRLECVGVHFSLGEVMEIGRAMAEAILAQTLDSKILLAIAASSLIKFEPKFVRAPIKRLGPMQFIYYAA